MSGRSQRFLCRFACLLAVILSLTLPAGTTANAAGTSARGAIVMECSTMRILYAKNIDTPLPMASTTKIMTALVAIERGNLSDVVKVPPQAVGVEGSSMYLEKDEQITLENLLYGLMLNSGNDAAVTIAIHIGGSVKGFVEMMNQKAAELGAGKTHFVTPNGLHDQNHYTTARDLGTIASYAMQNEVFRKIVSTQSREIPWNNRSYSRILRNKNRILWQYEGGNGVKTGYTKVAGRCLVAAAERDGMQLVSVVLDCGPMFEDCMAMMDDAFANYHMVTVMPEGLPLARAPVEIGVQNDVLLHTASDIRLPLKDDEGYRTEYWIDTMNLTAPVTAGQVAGHVVATLDECSITVPLIVSESVLARNYNWYLKRTLDFW